MFGGDGGGGGEGGGEGERERWEVQVTRLRRLGVVLAEAVMFPF